MTFQFQPAAIPKVPHLCLMNGMLMQLAAATAAKGMKRAIMGGRCWEGHSGKKHTQVFHSFITPQRWAEEVTENVTEGEFTDHTAHPFPCVIIYLSIYLISPLLSSK